MSAVVKRLAFSATWEKKGVRVHIQNIYRRFHDTEEIQRQGNVCIKKIKKCFHPLYLYIDLNKVINQHLHWNTTLIDDKLFSFDCRWEISINY